MIIKLNILESGWVKYTSPLVINWVTAVTNQLFTVVFHQTKLGYIRERETESNCIL